MLQHTKALLTRDLLKLKSEIESYQNEDNLWKIDGAISNSAGNLCLHLIGNLNHFIGATLGNSGYVRNRDLEFSAKNVARTELISKIEGTINVVGETLEKMKEKDLQDEYPLMPFNEKTTTEFMLFHLVTHLTYHLGQINYHRRLLDN